MEEKYLRTTMLDGSKWDIPIDLIADARARYYAKRGIEKGDKRPYQEIFKKEFVYAMNDSSVIIDWAENNMNWSDVKFYARLVDKTPKQKWEEGWCNGNKEIIVKDK